MSSKKRIRAGSTQVHDKRNCTNRGSRESKTEFVHELTAGFARHLSRKPCRPATIAILQKTRNRLLSEKDRKTAPIARRGQAGSTDTGQKMRTFN